MKKTKVVVFDAQGGWILTNPAKPAYEREPHIINPDLSLVKGLPPEQWALEGVRVVPKTERSRLPRAPINTTRVLLIGSCVLNLVLLYFIKFRS